jgi:hypothetical protein
MPIPDLELHQRKHPHEVWWFVVLLLSGVLGMIAFDRVASTSVRALHEPWGYLLYVGVAIWSAIGLAGIYWRKVLLGAIIEQVGLVGLSIYGITYAIIILGNAGILRGSGFGLVIGGLSIANLVRVWQIQKYLKAVQAARTMLREDN